MNFKVGDILCHSEKDGAMPFLKISYVITEINNPPLTDSNLNEDQNSYKIHVTITGCDKLTKEERQTLSDKYFPQENLDLTQPEIKTFLYFVISSYDSYFYKNLTEINQINLTKINQFYLIKCSDRVKIDGEFVIDEHNEKSVIPERRHIKSYEFALSDEYFIEEITGTFYKFTNVDDTKKPRVVYVPKTEAGLDYYNGGGSKQKKTRKNRRNRRKSNRRR